jgi:hypothetical protein
MVIRDASLKSTLSRYLIDRITASANIEVLARTEVSALHGDTALREITLRDLATGAERRVATRWLFVCIGGEPQTHWAESIGMERDEAGYILTGRQAQQGQGGPNRFNGLGQKMRPHRWLPPCRLGRLVVDLAPPYRRRKDIARPIVQRQTARAGIEVGDQSEEQTLADAGRPDDARALAAS